MAGVRDLVANLRVFQGLGQWAPDGHEEALASKASCRIERPVHPRQPTFMIEFAMTHDRPQQPLGQFRGTSAMRSLLTLAVLGCRTHAIDPFESADLLKLISLGRHWKGRS